MLAPTPQIKTTKKSRGIEGVNSSSAPAPDAIDDRKMRSNHATTGGGRATREGAGRCSTTHLVDQPGDFAILELDCSLQRSIFLNERCGPLYQQTRVAAMECSV